MSLSTARAAPRESLERVRTILATLRARLSYVVDLDNADLWAATGGSAESPFREAAAHAPLGALRHVVTLGKPDHLHAKDKRVFALAIRHFIAEGILRFTALEKKLQFAVAAVDAVERLDKEAAYAPKLHRNGSSAMLTHRASLLAGNMTAEAWSALAVAEVEAPPGTGTSPPSAGGAEEIEGSGSAPEAAADHVDGDGGYSSDSSQSSAGSHASHRSHAGTDILVSMLPDLTAHLDALAASRRGVSASRRGGTPATVSSDGGGAHATATTTTKPRTRTQLRGTTATPSAALLQSLASMRPRRLAFASPPSSSPACDIPAPHRSLPYSFHAVMAAMSTAATDDVHGVPRDQTSCWLGALAAGPLCALPPLRDAMETLLDTAAAGNVGPLHFALAYAYAVATGRQPSSGSEMTILANNILGIFQRRRGDQFTPLEVLQNAQHLIEDARAAPSPRLKGMESLTINGTFAAERTISHPFIQPRTGHTEACPQGVASVTTFKSSVVFSESATAEATTACCVPGALACRGADAAPAPLRAPTRARGELPDPAAWLWGIPEGTPIPADGTPAGAAISLLALLRHTEQAVHDELRHCDSCKRTLVQLTQWAFVEAPPCLVVSVEMYKATWAPSRLQLSLKDGSIQRYVLVCVLLRDGVPVVRRRDGQVQTTGHFMVARCVKGQPVVINDAHISNATHEHVAALSLKLSNAFCYAREEDVLDDAVLHLVSTPPVAPLAAKPGGGGGAGPLLRVPPQPQRALRTPVSTRELPPSSLTVTELLKSMELPSHGAPAKGSLLHNVLQGKVKAFLKARTEMDVFYNRWESPVSMFLLDDYIGLLKNKYRNVFVIPFADNLKSIERVVAALFADPLAVAADQLDDDLMEVGGGGDVYWQTLGKPDIFDASVIRHIMFFFGTLDKTHFILVVVDNISRTIATYDLFHPQNSVNEYSERAHLFLRKAWGSMVDTRTGCPRVDSSFPHYKYQAPRAPLARQGSNNHCGPIALCVAECIMRCDLPPSQEAVDAVEKLLPKNNAGENTFWAAYRRRVLLAIVNEELPPDIALFGVQGKGAATTS